MRRTGRFDGDRLVAGIVVLAAHVAFWWLLTRATLVPPPIDAPVDALQVRWIEPPAPRLPAPVEDAATTPAPPRPARRAPDMRTARRDAMASPAAVAPDAPMSAVFIEQARQAARARAQDDAPAADPFADRRAALPGRAGGAFRMREPPSLQGALRKVGRLFGGAGYDTDPCPRIRDNIASLANGEGAERELLAEELRRRRALCD